MKIGRLFRKIHKFLAIPMFIFVIAKMLSTGSSYEGIVMKITEATMILMLISGMVIYFQAARLKKKNID